MTQSQYLIKRKLNILALDKMLGNTPKVCWNLKRFTAEATNLSPFELFRQTWSLISGPRN